MRPSYICLFNVWIHFYDSARWPLYSVWRSWKKEMGVSDALRITPSSTCRLGFLKILWGRIESVVRFSRHPSFFDLAVFTPLPHLTFDFIAPQWTWSPALPPRRSEPFRLQTQVSAWLWGRAERGFSRCFTRGSQTPYLKLTATATLPTTPNRPGKVRPAHRQIKYIWFLLSLKTPLL